MSWWWPFGKQVIRKVAPHNTSHANLAAQYFWMSKHEQLRVLYYLEVPFEEQIIVHSSMRPFRDVKQEMEYNEPEKPWTADLFMDKLKALELLGKEIVIIAVLQNFFGDTDEARAYLPGVKKWPAVLKG